MLGMENILEFSTCRTCLKETSPTNCRILKPETIYDGKVLLKMLNFCIPEMFVDLSLEYPTICKKCLQMLNNLYKFKNMCLKNDLKYFKNDPKKDNLNDSSEVPSTNSKITNHSTRESSIPVDTARNNVCSDLRTDVNQNETSAISESIANQTNFNKEKVKKKILSPYRKRFTNPDCFGCQNHIREGKYHSDFHNRMYVCFNCGKKFTTIQEIRKHMHGHLYPYKCEICGKKWRDAHQLSQHLRTHTKQKPYECPECGKRFVQSYNLHQHLAIHKRDKDNRNRCEECGKVLSTKYNLKIHLTTHNIGYKPRCSVCNKWFYTEAALVKHSESCKIIKEENEIVIDEPEIIKTEVPEYVKPECLKEESQSDDDVFIEETPSQSTLTRQLSVFNNFKQEKFLKKEL